MQLGSALGENQEGKMTEVMQKHLLLEAGQLGVWWVGLGTVGRGEGHSVTTPDPGEPCLHLYCPDTAPWLSWPLWPHSGSTTRVHTAHLAGSKRWWCAGGGAGWWWQGTVLRLPGKAEISRSGDLKIRAINPRKASEIASSGIYWGCCVELALKGLKISEH